MQRYLNQLIHDLEKATQNIAWPFVEKELSIDDWQSPSEEDATAPVRNLRIWTGITPEMFPPASMLSDEQINAVLKAVMKLLAACNCHVVFQTEVPERFQYEAIREHIGQDIKVRQLHDGFFAFCKPGTPPTTCALGEYCQCAFYEDLFKNFVDEELSPEEERARELEIEVQYIRRKYDDDWMKYYPYHLDKNFDDESGNPFDYGIDDDKDDDSWWRK